MAFRQDQRVRRYEDFGQLLNYCRYSANPVGRLVLYLGRCHTPERVRLADSICTGLQLANFCQDVAARLGPRPDLPAAGRLPALRLRRGDVRRAGSATSRSAACWPPRWTRPRASCGAGCRWCR